MSDRPTDDDPRNGFRAGPRGATPETAHGDVEIDEPTLPMLREERMEENARTVQRGFWGKLRKAAGRLPFVDDLVASYFAAFDPETPLKVKAVLLAALAYFVMPADMIPDIITGLGFTDDATVLATAIGLVGTHIKARHRRRAAEILRKDLKHIHPDRDIDAEPTEA